MTSQVRYSEAIADQFCEQIIEGKSIIQVCKAKGMPNRSTIFRWMETNEAFATRCARARSLQAEYMDDLILEVAYKSTPESAPSDRVKLSAYQWRASKLSPKKYGEKLQHTGADGTGPVETTTTLVITGVPRPPEVE